MPPKSANKAIVIVKGNLPFIAITVAAAMLFFWAMLPYGGWAQSDTVDYVQSARHLVEGRGLTVYQSDGTLVPLAHFPPGYPFAIAAAMALGLDWVSATRLVAALAAGALAFLLAKAAATALQQPAAALLAVPVLAILPVARLLVAAMSEPPYFVMQALWVLALWWAFRAQSRRERRWWLIAAGFAIGMGVLTRYAGLHALLTALVFLALPREEWLSAAAALYAPPLAMFLGWKTWLTANHAPAIGHLAMHPQEWARRLPTFFAQTAQAFILPWGETLPFWVVVVFWTVVLALALGAVFSLRKFRPKTAQFLGGIWMIEGVSAFPFMLASYALFRPTPALDWRIYAPASLALTMGILLWVSSGFQTIANWRVGFRGITVLFYGLAAMVGLAMLLLPTPQHVTLTSLHQKGLGYTSQEWYTLRRDLLPRVRLIAQEVPLVSNDAGGLILWCDCPAHHFVSLHNHTRPPRPLGTLKDDAAHRLVWRGAAFVLILAPPARQDLAWWGDPKEIARRLTAGLYPCYQTSLGGIYFYSKPPQESWCAKW